MSLHIDILAIIPNLLDGAFTHSILDRAQKANLLKVEVHDLREYGLGKHRQIDDYQYGGGAGMVLMAEPMANAIRSLQKKRTYDEIIFLTPDGKTLDQGIANGLSMKQNLLLLCGHYKGLDQRIRDKFVTKEISIGDYVLSGGELAAAVLTDAIGRLIPGVLNDETSALTDSFQDGLLAPPVYTRPAKFEDDEVPPVLLSGHEQKVQEWREEKALEKTKQIRPDLLK